MVLTGWTAVFFWVFAIAAIFAGLLTGMARNTIHSALFLISALVSVSALFILLGAEFIAGVQILVYVGGVMVLFLFVIMLVNVGAEERGDPAIFNSSRQVVASMIFCLLLVVGLLLAVQTGWEALNKSDQNKRDAVSASENSAQLPPNATGVSRITRDTTNVGTQLYSFASLPFEIASVLLLVAIIGSVMLARTLKQEVAADDVAPEIIAAEVPGSTDSAAQVNA